MELGFPLGLNDGVELGRVVGFNDRAGVGWQIGIENGERHRCFVPSVRYEEKRGTVAELCEKCSSLSYGSPSTYGVARAHGRTNVNPYIQNFTNMCTLI